MKILSGTSNPSLSKSISKHLKLKLVNTNIKNFADGGGMNDGGGMSPKTIACIKKKGGGEQTGRLVGGGLGTAAVTSTGLASVPIVGWVLAGAATMIGMDQGAEIGGQMAEDLAKECEEAYKL